MSTFERIWERAEEHEASKREYKALVGELSMRVRKLEAHNLRMQRREAGHATVLNEQRAKHADRLLELTVRARVMEREAREHYRKWRAVRRLLDEHDIPAKPMTDERDAELRNEVEEYFHAVHQDVESEVADFRMPLEFKVVAAGGEGQETGGT